MKIQQIQEFTFFDRRGKQLVIVEFRRRDDSFFMEKRTQDGKTLESKTVTELFVKTVLDYALMRSPKEDYEITQLSAGTVFNYPIPHI